jgi:hypothetical protein
LDKEKIIGKRTEPREAIKDESIRLPTAIRIRCWSASIQIADKIDNVADIDDAVIVSISNTYWFRCGATSIKVGD